MFPQHISKVQKHCTNRLHGWMRFNYGKLRSNITQKGMLLVWKHISFMKPEIFTNIHVTLIYWSPSMELVKPECNLQLNMLA